MLPEGIGSKKQPEFPNLHRGVEFRSPIIPPGGADGGGSPTNYLIYPDKIILDLEKGRLKIDSTNVMSIYVRMRNLIFLKNAHVPQICEEASVPILEAGEKISAMSVSKVLKMDGSNELAYYVFHLGNSDESGSLEIFNLLSRMLSKRIELGSGTTDLQNEELNKYQKFLTSQNIDVLAEAWDKFKNDKANEQIEHEKKKGVLSLQDGYRRLDEMQNALNAELRSNLEYADPQLRLRDTQSEKSEGLVPSLIRRLNLLDEHEVRLLVDNEVESLINKGLTNDEDVRDIAKSKILSPVYRLVVQLLENKSVDEDLKTELVRNRIVPDLLNPNSVFHEEVLTRFTNYPQFRSELLTLLPNKEYQMFFSVIKDRIRSSNERDRSHAIDQLKFIIREGGMRLSTDAIVDVMNMARTDRINQLSQENTLIAVAWTDFAISMVESLKKTDEQLASAEALKILDEQVSQDRLNCGISQRRFLSNYLYNVSTQKGKLSHLDNAILRKAVLKKTELIGGESLVYILKTPDLPVEILDPVINMILPKLTGTFEIGGKTCRYQLGQGELLVDLMRFAKRSKSISPRLKSTLLSIQQDLRDSWDFVKERNDTGGVYEVFFLKGFIEKLNSLDFQ